MTWITEVTTDVPEWALREIEERMVSFDEDQHEVTGEIPGEVRMMVARSQMFKNQAEVIRLGATGKGIDGVDPEWCDKQAYALDVLINVSLQHVGIVYDTTCILGEGWKLLKLKHPSQIIVADDKMIKIVSAGHLALGMAKGR